jgi:hypothetical protein
MAATPPNYKPPIFQKLFDERWDSATQSLPNPNVTLDEVFREIHQYNETYKPKRPISPKNAANFFKDYVRRIENANRVWPMSIRERGYTAVQQTAGGRCFAFIRIPDGQPTPFVAVTPPDDLDALTLSTLQIPTLARRISRRDERWLMQVAVRLQIVESHLAAHAPALVYVELLQMGVKQKAAEIDALYMAKTGDERNVIITVEAKTNDDIYYGQIISQVAAAKAMKSLGDCEISYIIPLAVKSFVKRGVFVAQFDSVRWDEDEERQRIDVVARSMFSLKPSLPRI